MKLSANECAHLVECLRDAHMSGVRTHEEFLNWLDGRNAMLLYKARDFERRPNPAYKKLAKRLRASARLSRRLHTKIVNS